MKKILLILFSLFLTLTFTACFDSVEKAVTETTSEDSNSGETGDTGKTYFYSATGAIDIESTWGEWSTGTTIESDVALTPYTNVIKLTAASGTWGNVLAFPELTAGLFAEYTTLEFKIKTDSYSEIQVKLPDVEKIYQLSSGTDLGNGWIQMSIPLADFASVLDIATEFAIFNNTQYSAGTIMYLTDICLTGATTDDGVDGIDDSTGPTVVAPSTLPATASVLYSSDITTASSYATITDYAQNWYGAIAYSQVDVAGEDVLRYTSSGLSGECMALASDSFNVSDKTRFHMDIYLSGVDYFQLKFVDGSGASKMVNLHTVPDFDGALIAEGQWVTIDMSIADMSIPGGGGTINWADLKQTGILLTAAASGDRAYIDNMYFY